MLTTASGARAVARCDALGIAPYSDMADGLFRAYLTPAHRAAQGAVAQWMADAGMATRIDAAGNLIGRYEGATPDAPALIIGSHIDSVRDAGRYDGALGVMLGIECVAMLAGAKTRLPFAVAVVAFGDEEGSRFPAAMLTSRAITGTLDPAMLTVADDAGMTLAQALAGQGLNIADFGQAQWPADRAIAYLEAHIEQGPVLEHAGLPVASVSGIAAQLRYAVSVDGRAGHAGTTVMALRRDALAAAAECVTAVEAVARASTNGLVATVGRLSASPGAANVIAGHVDFAIDVRAADQADRDAGAAAILEQFAAIAARRDVTIAWQVVQSLPASPCDPRLTALLDAAIVARGIAPMRIVSGAGHDAMVMATLCPTAMLFIRCGGGISHHPDEQVAADDAAVALAVMTDFIARLAETMP